MRSRTRSSIVATTAGLLVVLLSATPTRAQEVKGGFSMATIHFSPESGSPELSSTKSLTGFVGGVSFLAMAVDRGGWQVEVLVHQKGARNLLRVDDRLRLTYLEVPVLMHMDFYQRDPRALFFVVGVAPAVKVRAWYEDEGVEKSVTDDIEDFDVGLVAGAGVDLRHLTLEARYTWGLRSAFQDGELEGTFKNRTFTFTIGLRLGR